MKKYTLVCLLLFALVWMTKANNVSQYNVVWDTPSENSLGSMPLGNGKYALNIWVEENGNLIFYISSTDAFDSKNNVIKLGRIDIAITPCPFKTGMPFRQELNLEDGSLLIKAGESGSELTIKAWVDANYDVIHIDAQSINNVDIQTKYSVDWRKPSIIPNLSATNDLDGDFIYSNEDNEVSWFHRNKSSLGKLRLEQEGLTDLSERLKDPFINRTFGGIMAGKDFKKIDVQTLKATEKKEFNISIFLLNDLYDDVNKWYTDLRKYAAKYKKLDPKNVEKKHKEWWAEFWNRSYIHLSGFKDAYMISSRYAHQRFINACSNRGTYPVLYNGSVFNVDMPDGFWTFFGPKKAADADYRPWGTLPIMWQNTRHPYWPMMMSGDYDLMKPVMNMWEIASPIAQARAKKWFNVDGAIMTESMLFNGACVHGRKLPKHLDSHFLGGIEISSMMLDYVLYTGDKKFAKEKLLPYATEYMAFYENTYTKKDKNGKRIFYPGSVAETYKDATNPVTEISCLRYLLDGLLSLDNDIVDAKLRARFQDYRQSMPEIPVRYSMGQKMLAVADDAKGRLLIEAPELYAVTPFKQVKLWDKDLLSAARKSFYVRDISLDGTDDTQWAYTGGWSQNVVAAALMALPKEAGILVTENFRDELPFPCGNCTPFLHPFFPEKVGRKRFPAFWEAHYDWTPDQCHAGNSLNALHNMLIQIEGKKIYLLPSIPENWDVKFKLHAPYNTIINCEYQNGEIVNLEVTPESRRKDIINLAVLEKRIENMVDIAGADLNYLYGKEPMPDARFDKDRLGEYKITKSWLSKYGESLYDTNALLLSDNSWGTALFRNNVIYVHLTDDEQTNVRILLPHTRVLSAMSLTGNNVSAVMDGDFLIVNCSKRKDKNDEALHRIVQVNMDRPIMEIALSLPHLQSHSYGCVATVEGAKGDIATSAIDGNPSTYIENAKDNICLTLSFNEKKSIRRIEILKNDSDWERGKGYNFYVEYKDENNEWKKLVENKIFGRICTRKVPEVKAQEVRLVTNSPSIAQFDLYNY